MSVPTPGGHYNRYIEKVNQFFFAFCVNILKSLEKYFEISWKIKKMRDAYFFTHIKGKKKIDLLKLKVRYNTREIKDC